MVTDAEIRQKFEKENSKVKFDYAVLRKDDILKELHPTDSELKAFYDRSKASYNNSIPEKRKIKYALIDTAKLQSEAQVSQQDLQSYYDQRRDHYRAPKQAQDVLAQLKAVAKFEDLAKKYSEDPSSKDGGSVGWINRGGFPVPEV